MINILEYLEDSAQKNPSKIAFTDFEKEITYSDFLKKSKKIASSLLLEVNNRRKPIAVLFDRDIESLITFMAIVYSGNFYVPININLPKHRIDLILKTSKPELIITKRKDIVVIKESENDTQIKIYEEVVNSIIDEKKLKEIRDQMIDNDPLYTIFTSGSTGVPKGVVINHRSVINYIEQFCDLFNFSEETNLGNQAAFDFDGSVKDIYTTLRNGATMHIIPTSLFSFPKNLIDYLNQHKINTITWSTSALRIIENFRAFDYDIPKYIKTITFSGEIMPIKVLNYWREALPGAMFVNLYGPTEATVNSLFYIVDREFDSQDILPIGKVFPNTDVLILNRMKKNVTENEIGEIYIRGVGLALGYYNNPKLTKKFFIQNPTNSIYPETVFRTGDLGYVNENGEFVFVSRNDSQIKHNGHRIELGEIELLVNNMEFIDVAICYHDPERDLIVLFYQAFKNYDLELLKHLRNHLPKFMLPNKLYQIEKLPINKNGKIDRLKMKEKYDNHEL